MNKTQSLLAVAAAGFCLALPQFAAAQQPKPADGPDAIIVYSDEDAGAILDARITALKTVLRLTASQEKLWPPVEASIRKLAAASIARAKARSEAEPPATFLDVLGRVADAEATRAAELKEFVAAAQPLVASLTDAQKDRMPAFLGMAVDPATPLSTQSLWLFEEEER